MYARGKLLKDCTACAAGQFLKLYNNRVLKNRNQNYKTSRRIRTTHDQDPALTVQTPECPPSTPPVQIPIPGASLLGHSRDQRTL